MFIRLISTRLKLSIMLISAEIEMVFFPEWVVLLKFHKQSLVKDLFWFVSKLNGRFKLVPKCCLGNCNSNSNINSNSNNHNFINYFFFPFFPKFHLLMMPKLYLQMLIWNEFICFCKNGFKTIQKDKNNSLKHFVAKKLDDKSIFNDISNTELN